MKAGPSSSVVARSVVRTARPRQWTKNILVVAAPVLSGQVLQPPVALNTGVAMIAFVVASSGVYFVNDAHDVALDRAHPVKRSRPVAAGILSPATAYAIGFTLLGLVSAASLLWRREFGIVVTLYAIVSVAYCFWLKSEPVIDIVAVASGFLLRTIAGGAASGIPLSEWFLLAASFGSLFVAAGKRYAEISHPDIVAGTTRPSLARYTPTYLRFVWTMSAGILVMTYGLWAFDERVSLSSMLPVLSIAPFVLGVLRFAFHVDAGDGGEPEEIVLRDRWLQLIGVAWAALVVAAVFS